MAEILSSSAPTISFDPPQKLTPGMVYQPGIASVKEEASFIVTMTYHNGEKKVFSQAQLKKIGGLNQICLLSYNESGTQHNIIIDQGREYTIPSDISLLAINPILSRDAHSADTLASFQIGAKGGENTWIAFDHNGCFLGKRGINSNIAQSNCFAEIKKTMESQHVAVVETNNLDGNIKYSVFLSTSDGIPKDTSISSDKPISVSYGPAGVVCVSETRLGATSIEMTGGEYNNESRFISFFGYGENDTLVPTNPDSVVGGNLKHIVGQRFQGAYMLPDGKPVIVYTDANREKFSILYNGETKDFTSELTTQAQKYEPIVGGVEPLKDIRDFSKPIIQAPNRLGFSTKNRNPSEIFWVIGGEEAKKVGAADRVADVLKTDEDSKVKALMTPESCLILQQKINSLSFEKINNSRYDTTSKMFKMRHEPVPGLPMINTGEQLQFCEEYLDKDSQFDIKYNGRNAIDGRRISHDKEYIKALKENPKLFMMFYYRYILFVKTLAASLSETQIPYENKVVLEKQQQSFGVILGALAVG